MKIQTKKIKGSISSSVADTLGREHEELREAAEVANAQLGQKRDQIKQEARQNGETVGKETLLFGKRFVVGYCSVDGRTVFNPELAKSLLTKKQWAECCSMQIDERKVQKAVMSGKIKKSVFLRMFDSGKPFQRIVVRRENKNQA